MRTTIFLLAALLAIADLRAADGNDQPQIEVRLSIYIDMSGDGEPHVMKLGKEPKTYTFRIEDAERLSLRMTPLDGCKVSVEILGRDNVTTTRPLTWPAAFEPGSTFAIGLHFPRHRQEVRGSVSGVGSCSRTTTDASTALAASPELVSAAREQTRSTVIYDGAYVRIGYPMGDVPANRGVCTDVVIRAYRAIGVDLQALVHEDMRAHFDLYPRLWGLREPDTNIDHRRVPNLQKFLERAGAKIRAPDASYLPGDLVTWMLPGNLPHIGIVSDRQAPGSGNPLIIHNIGAGTVEEDMLFAHPITGHYRYRVQ